jgi:DNA-binding MarR family transcriptional regulator
MGTPPPLTDSEDEFWRALALVLHTLPRTLENDLQTEANISSPEYAALKGMASDGQDGLSINELAAIVGLSPSRTSRLADALVARGEAERRQGAMDRRSQLVSITEKGLNRLRMADPHYLASVRLRILDLIDSDDYVLLTQALRTIVEEPVDQHDSRDDGVVSRQLSA